MANGHVCCILGVCCPPGSAKQFEALTEEITHMRIMDKTKAQKIAQRLLNRYNNFEDVIKEINKE